MANKKIKVFDFFSGCGGTSMGLKHSGMDIVLALDTDKDALETFEKNLHPEKVICRDIREVQTSEVNELVKKYNKENLILFCGCAPCQPFSAQNKKRFSESDNRISLLTEFGRFVKDCEPDFIFCENVPGMQKIKDENGPLNNFIDLLKSLGYYVNPPQIVRAENYGVPQRRKRLILIASKLGKVKFPDETHGCNKLPYSTVEDVLKDIPPVNAGQEHPDKKNWPNHKAACLNDLNLKRIRSIKEGQGRVNWPKQYQLNCHKNYDGHNDVYGRLKWDEPSVTLTTRCTSISNGRFGHPVQDRALSVREAACLQTFPLNFEFHGSGLGAMARQVGNAVPVKLAEVFGKSFIESAKLYSEADQDS